MQKVSNFGKFIQTKSVLNERCRKLRGPYRNAMKISTPFSCACSKGVEIDAYNNFLAE